MSYVPWWIMIGALVALFGVLTYLKRPRKDSLPWASDSERRQFKNNSGKPHAPPPADFSSMG
jgi:hypothetical protein